MTQHSHPSHLNANQFALRSPVLLEDWATDIFKACGLASDHAAEAGKILVRSELRGYKTHGMTRIPSYVERLKARDFNPSPDIRSRAFPGGVVLDTDGAMGQIAVMHALRVSLKMLDSSASVLVAIQGCGHLGALGIYALSAAEAGAFCVLGQRTPPILGMQGFVRPALGHNPIAFGCPLPGGDPIVFDIACSVAARGHILLAAREGRPIPETWALDEFGAPTTDAQHALKGSLLPMGGHKGIGIAMMVEVLAGALCATAESLEPGHDELPVSGAMGRQSAFMWLVRPNAFVAEDLFDAYMSRWTDNYLSAGNGQARLPGSRGSELEAKGRAEGIPLGATVEQDLIALGERLSLPFPF